LFGKWKQLLQPIEFEHISTLTSLARKHPLVSLTHVSWSKFSRLNINTMLTKH
jgi:hypothetical protein